MDGSRCRALAPWDRGRWVAACCAAGAGSFRLCRREVAGRAGGSGSATGPAVGPAGNQPRLREREMRSEGLPRHPQSARKQTDHVRVSSPGTARGRCWLTGPGLAAGERRMKVIRMTRAETGSRPLRDSEADSPSGAAPQSLELRHLRYFVVVADAGTFTHAAERLFIAQPTLSQQIQRLEQIVGTPLLRRQRDGVRLTAAGTVLLDASRDVLSVADHAVSQTRQAAGLGRLRLRFVLSADLPDSLAVTTTSRLRSAAEAAGAALTWLETTLDADFSSIRQRRADAGLGWLPATPDPPTGVLTGPSAIAGPPPGVTRLPRPTSTADMTRASIAGHPLTATAALVWHGDLPRPLQQILFDTADGVPPPAPASPEPASPLPTAPRPGQDCAAEPADGETPAVWAPQLTAGRTRAGLCPVPARR